jgi:hypothetical protein
MPLFFPKSTMERREREKLKRKSIAKREKHLNLNVMK